MAHKMEFVDVVSAVEAEAEKARQMVSEPEKPGLDLLPPEVLKKVSVKAEEKLEQESWSRREKREKEPTVQMSLRMKEPVYESFRRLCIATRLTNGEMLEAMMASYLREREQHPHK
jgi:hypothetical protein